MIVGSKLKKIHSDSSALNQIQDSYLGILNPILSNPLLYGNLVKGIKLMPSKDNFVSTGLGRNFIGYFITRRYDSKGFIDIFESDTNNTAPDKFIILNCFDSLTCDLWIF